MPGRRLHAVALLVFTRSRLAVSQALWPSITTTRPASEPGSRLYWPEGAGLLGSDVGAASDDKKKPRRHASQNEVMFSYIFTFLTAYSIRYALRRSSSSKSGDPASTPPQRPSKPREVTWDLMRFFFETLVVLHHVSPWSEDIKTSLLTESGERAADFRMNCFVFISGVFGSSMKYKSVANMFCYTLGTNIYSLYFFALCDSLKGGGFVKSLLRWQRGSGQWFLWCLFGWRVWVTP